jgi:glutaredoxin
MPLLIWFILLSDALLGRKPIQRTAEEQARVDRESAGLRLYHFVACPYCRKVRRDVRLMALTIEVADIKRDPAAKAALVAGGGKKQVPALRIEEPSGVRWMYESTDISRYLRERFAA